MNLRPSERDRILLRRLLEDSDESATVALFMRMYRQSPELRHWLHEDFARSEAVRTKFDALAGKRRRLSVTRFAELTDFNGPWSEERRRLKKQISGRIYGGLTWNEVMRLVHECQAGGLDLGVFLLVRDWQKAGNASPALMWAGLAFLDSVLPSGRRRLLRHLNEALAFIREYENKARQRTAVGYADWWKLQVLLYMLQHPCDSYRTRELQTHLAGLDLNVSAQDLRRFCKRHGIHRDMQAGRPRSRASGTTVTRVPKPKY